MKEKKGSLREIISLSGDIPARYTINQRFDEIEELKDEGFSYSGIYDGMFKSELLKCSYSYFMNCMKRIKRRRKASLDKSEGKDNPESMETSNDVQDPETDEDEQSRREIFGE